MVGLRLTPNGEPFLCGWTCMMCNSIATPFPMHLRLGPSVIHMCNKHSPASGVLCNGCHNPRRPRDVHCLWWNLVQSNKKCLSCPALISYNGYILVDLSENSLSLSRSFWLSFHRFIFFFFSLFLSACVACLQTYWTATNHIISQRKNLHAPPLYSKNDFHHWKTWPPINLKSPHWSSYCRADRHWLAFWYELMPALQVNTFLRWVWKWGLYTAKWSFCRENMGAPGSSNGSRGSPGTLFSDKPRSLVINQPTVTTNLNRDEMSTWGPDKALEYTWTRMEVGNLFLPHPNVESTHFGSWSI